MKILHAVENSALADNAVRMIHSLRFKDAQISIVHVIQRLEPLVALQAKTGHSDIITSFYKLQEDSAKEGLAEVAALYGKEGLSVESRVVTGFTTSALLSEAHRAATDLLVVASRKRSVIERFTTESICMSLLHKAPQSVMIVRDAPQQKDGISAILATDHSEYCDSAMRQLKEFVPRGIKQLLIVSCFPAPLCRALEAAPRPEAKQRSAEITAELESHNQTLAAHLASLGTRITTLVSAKPPQEAIPMLIKDSGAELLILGAQGHGLLDRLALGSVSHSLVSKTHCSVLVLRGSASATARSS